MPFSGSDLDAYQATAASPLAVLEKKQRTFLGVSWGEAKLLTLASVGFFMDAYDLFIINMIVSAASNHAGCAQVLIIGIHYVVLCDLGRLLPSLCEEHRLGT